MSTFGIVDNNLDPDSQDNRPKKAPKALPVIPVDKFEGFLKDSRAKGTEQKFIDWCEKHHTLNTAQVKALDLLKAEL